MTVMTDSGFLFSLFKAIFSAPWTSFMTNYRAFTYAYLTINHLYLMGPYCTRLRLERGPVIRMRTTRRWVTSKGADTSVNNFKQGHQEHSKWDVKNGTQRDRGETRKKWQLRSL